MNAPTLTASTNEKGVTVLSWNAVANAETYFICRREVGDDGWMVAESIDADSSTFTYTDTSASFGVTYEYYVGAYNWKHNIDAPSNIVKGTRAVN